MLFAVCPIYAQKKGSHPVLVKKPRAVGKIDPLLGHEPTFVSPNLDFLYHVSPDPPNQ